MEIKGFIKYGESETLEFKEKFDDRTVESAVAFVSSIMRKAAIKPQIKLIFSTI